MQRVDQIVDEGDLEPLGEAHGEVRVENAESDDDVGLELRNGPEEFDAVTTDCAGCEMQLRAVSGLPAHHPIKLLWLGHGERPLNRA